MTDPAIVARANEIIGRLFALDEEIANGRAFRDLLENLHARDRRSVVKEPHITAIRVVRAGILRAFISSLIACLDRSDWRQNRASIGQILRLLDEDAEVAALFKPETTALQRATDEHEDLVKSELFKRVTDLRNKTIAHLLRTNGNGTTARPTEYKTLYELHDAAERITTDLFEACGRGKPTFLARRATMRRHAEIFWDTYFAGMRR